VPVSPVVTRKCDSLVRPRESVLCDPSTAGCAASTTILAVDNLPSGTLQTGYEFVRDAPPRLGTGRAYALARDAALIPYGPAHAVEPGEQRSVCGRTMAKIETSSSWPPVMADRCRDCPEA
jgi:hypothetical protein